jgi:hypothetical protein
MSWAHRLFAKASHKKLSVWHIIIKFALVTLDSFLEDRYWYSDIDLTIKSVQHLPPVELFLVRRNHHASEESILPTRLGPAAHHHHHHHH